MSMPPSVLHAHSIAGGWDRRGPFLDTCSVRPAAPVAQPVPQPPRTPVARPAPAPAPSKGTLVAAHQSVYIWEDMGRKHNGIQIYKIGIALTHRVEQRMQEVARACAANPKLIHHVPVHNAPDVEELLLRWGGEVPGNTDGKSEFRTLAPAQLRKCIADMEAHRATGLAPPPAPKPLTLKARKAAAKEARRLASYNRSKEFRAVHGILPREMAWLQKCRTDMHRRMAGVYLRDNDKFGWLRTFKYTGQELPADIEADVWAQVDAKYPLPTRGA